jgi:hypothetical protein
MALAARPQQLKVRAHRQRILKVFDRALAKTIEILFPSESELKIL